MSRSSRAGTPDLVGVDFARVRSASPRRRAWLPAALIGALLAAMGLAELRLQILRMRYALGEATVETQNLREERSRLTAQLAAQRGPERLARLARARGFAAPERVILLDTPRPGPGVRP